jgi:hypothetical protein
LCMSGLDMLAWILSTFSLSLVGFSKQTNKQTTTTTTTTTAAANRQGSFW